MDAQLKELIDTIKTEGIETAEAKADEIVQGAEKRAQEITQDAEKRAEETVRKAEAEARKREEAARAAVQQAGRDLLLAVRNRLISILRNLVEEETKSRFEGKVLEEAIVGLVSNWSPEKGSDITVLLPQKQYEKLEKNLRSRLAEELKSGANIAPSERVDSGFRITEQEGTVHYDFTADAIAEALAQFLSPRLAETVREAAQE